MTPKRMLELGNKVEELLRHEHSGCRDRTARDDAWRKPRIRWISCTASAEKPVWSDRSHAIGGGDQPGRPVNCCAPCVRRRVPARARACCIMNEKPCRTRGRETHSANNTETFVSLFWGRSAGADPDRGLPPYASAGKIHPSAELAGDVHLIKLASGLTC